MILRICVVSAYEKLRFEPTLTKESYLQNKLGEVAEGQTPGLSQPRKYDRETGEYVYLKGEYIFPFQGFAPENLKQLKLDRHSNPYKGLASFDPKDSDLFFGRKTLSQQLGEIVVKQPLTIVLGVSGSGKSSLVKAGLIPALESGRQKWVIPDPMRPGESPFKALNKILTQSESGSSIIDQTAEEQVKILLGKISYLINPNSEFKLLLIIDQTEELLTLSRNQETRENFLNLLAELLIKHPQRLHIVLTLRSDFEPQLRDAIAEPHWQKAWQEGRFFVTPMNREELQQAIEEPAAQQTLFFESPKLVNQLIDEAIDTPGALPLLSFTLSELYLKYLQAEENRERDDRTITEADYEKLGGVARSLTQTADKTYQELVEKEKINPSIIRNVMLRMVSISSGELARRRVPTSELIYPESINEQAKKVIDRFLEARLLVTGLDTDNQAYVEPAHDALVRGWPKLLKWVKEEKNLRLQRRLTPAAQEWESFKNKDKEQPKGILDKIDPVLDWLDRRLFFPIENKLNKIPAQFARLLRRSLNQQERSREKPVQFLWNANPYLNVLDKELKSDDNWLNQVEAEFVQESVLQKRQNISWRWRIATAVIVGLTLLTFAALIGQRNAQIAQIQALIESSDARFAARQEFDALLDSLRAAKKLRELFLGSRDSQMKEQIAQVVQQAVYGVKEYNRLESDFGIVGWSRNLISWSPDGQILAFATGNNTVKLWQPGGDDTPKTLKGKEDHEDSIIGVSWSKDGILVTASQDGTVILWDRNGNQQKSFELGQSGKIYGVNWSPDGQFLAFPAQNKNVYLRRRDGLPLPSLSGQDIAVFAVSWSRDGILASAAGDRTVKLWKPGESQPITLQDHPDWVIGVSWSYDGKILASTSSDIIKLWNQDGTPYTTADGDQVILEHPENVESLGWSSNGILASGSEDRTIRLWRSDGTLLDIFKAHGLVQSLSWSPDGKVLAAESKDGTIQFWKVNSLLTSFVGHSETVNSVSWNHDGELLASGSDDDTIRLWTKDSIPYTTLNSNRYDVKSVSWSRDGILASAHYDSVQLWTRDGKQFNSKILDHYEYKALHYRGSRTPVNSVSWSFDGQFLATASNGARVQLWDRHGNPQKDSDELNHKDWLYDVSWSRNGRLASASKDGNIKILKLDGTLPKEFFGRDGSVWSVDWSLDGQILASAHGDYTIRLWDRNGKFLNEHMGHENEVLSVSWSPDGQILASASKDSTVKLWKLDDTQDKPRITPITTFKGHENAVNEVSWSPDGKSLATASSDKTVKLWQLDVNLEDEEQFLEDLLVYGCNWIRNYLKNNPNVEESDRHLCDNVPKLVISED